MPVPEPQHHLPPRAAGVPRRRGRRLTVAAAAAAGLALGLGVAATAGTSATATSLAPVPGVTTTAVATAQGAVLRLGSDKVLRANAVEQSGDQLALSTTTTTVRASVDALLDAFEGTLVVRSGSTVLAVDRGTGATRWQAPAEGLVVVGTGRDHLLVDRAGRRELVDLRTRASRVVSPTAALVDSWLVESAPSGSALRRTDLDTGSTTGVGARTCADAAGAVSGAWTFVRCPGAGTVQAQEAGSSRGGSLAVDAGLFGDGVAVGVQGSSVRVADFTSGAVTTAGTTSTATPWRQVVDVDEAGRYLVWLGTDGRTYGLQLVDLVDSADERAYRAAAGQLGTEQDLPRPLAGGAAEWPFATGGIFSRPGQQSQVVTGDAWAAYLRSGGAAGPLGAATSAPLRVRDGGELQRFERGSVYRSPATGTRFLHGPVLQGWGALGWENGVLGYPTSDVRALRSGSFAGFQGGSVYWSPATGAHDVRGPIRDRWGALGWEGGRLGFPTSGETKLRNGAFSSFQGGSVYWSPATGAHQVGGAIVGRWASLGWENGSLGYPTTDETALRGGAFNHFQGGSVYWSPATGAHAVQGQIRARWRELGWENGRLGYPTSDEFSVPGGRRSDFEGGSLVWTQATGAVRVLWR